MALELFQQTFLGASITNFSVNVGLNSNSSTLNVSLVRDPINYRVGSAVDEGYHSWQETNQSGSIHGFPDGSPVDYQSTGDVFYAPVPGSPVYFNYYVYDSQESDNSYTNQNFNKIAGLQAKKSNNKRVFEFNGLLKSYQRDQSTSGENYSVTIEDPRTVLEGTKVILDGYSGTTAPPDASYNVITSPFNRRLSTGWLGYYNILNPFGYYEGGNNFGQAQTNNSGISWYNPAKLTTRYGITHATGVLPALDAMLSGTSTGYKTSGEPFGGPIYYGQDYRLKQSAGAIATLPVNSHRYLVDLTRLYNLHTVNGGILPSDFRLSGQETSLLQVIQSICDAAGADFFLNTINPVSFASPIINLATSFYSGVIQVVPISRNFVTVPGSVRSAVDQALEVDSNGLPDGKGPWANKMVSANVGYEFNDRVNGVMMFGAPRTRVVGVTPLGKLTTRNDIFSPDFDADGKPDEFLIENSPSTEMDGATLYGLPLDDSADQLYGISNDNYVAWNYPGGTGQNKLKNLNRVETTAGRTANNRPIDGEGLIDLFPVWGYTKRPLYKTSGLVQVEAQGWPIIGRFNDDDPYRDWDTNDGHISIVRYYNSLEAVPEFRCLTNEGVEDRFNYWVHGGESGHFTAGGANGKPGEVFYKEGRPKKPKNDLITSQAKCRVSPDHKWTKVLTFPCLINPHSENCTKAADPASLANPMTHRASINPANRHLPAHDRFNRVGKNKDNFQLNAVHDRPQTSSTVGVCLSPLDPRGKCVDSGIPDLECDEQKAKKKNDNSFDMKAGRNKGSCHKFGGQWVGQGVYSRPNTATIPIEIPYYDGGPVSAKNGDFSKFYYATVTELRAAAVGMDSWLGFLQKYDPYLPCYMDWQECPLNEVSPGVMMGMLYGGIANPIQVKKPSNPKGLKKMFITRQCTKDVAALNPSEFENMQKQLIFKKINAVATQFYGRVYAMALPVNELDPYKSEGDMDNPATGIDESSVLESTMDKWIRIVNDDVIPQNNGRVGTFQYEHKWDIANAGWPGVEVRFDNDKTNTRHPQNVNFFDDSGNLGAFLLYPTTERLKLCGEDHTLNFDDIPGNGVHHTQSPHSLGPVKSGNEYTRGKSYVKAQVDPKIHYLFNVSTIDIHAENVDLEKSISVKPFAIISTPSPVRYNLPDHLDTGVTGECVCGEETYGEDEKKPTAGESDPAPGSDQEDGVRSNCLCYDWANDTYDAPPATNQPDNPQLNEDNCMNYCQNNGDLTYEWHAGGEEVTSGGTPAGSKAATNQTDCEKLGKNCMWVATKHKLCIPHVRVRDAGQDLSAGFKNAITMLYGKQFTNHKFDLAAASNLAQDTGRIQLVDAAYKPWGAGVPQQSNRYTWGPWSQGIGFGQAKIDFATDFHPAAFGSEALMNVAAIARCNDNTKPDNQVLETGSVTLAGAPMYGIGEQIIGTGVGPYITDISVDITASDLTTTYTMKVERKFGELNEIYEKRIRNTNEAFLRAEQQLRSMQKSVKLPNPKDFDRE